MPSYLTYADYCRRLFGTTVQKICQLNGIKPSMTLQIGMRLRVK